MENKSYIGGESTSKRKYALVQEMKGEILAMREAGTTRREIAGHLGLSKKKVKDWITRSDRRQAQLTAGIQLRPKRRPRKGAKFVSKEEEQAYEIQRLLRENKLLRNFLQFAGGGESEYKIPHHISSISSQRGISSIRHVYVFWCIKKRPLCFCPASWQTGERCCPFGTHYTATGTQLRYLWATNGCG